MREVMERVVKVSAKGMLDFVANGDCCGLGYSAERNIWGTPWRALRLGIGYGTQGGTMCLEGWDDQMCVCVD